MREMAASAKTKKGVRTITPLPLQKLSLKKHLGLINRPLSYLFERTDYERQNILRYNVTTFNLDRMKKLLSLLGNPHKKIATVHIAGTKGKGSTCTMLAKMLEANGYKVGLYTSPHVVSLHERIMVNSTMISESEMLGLINRVHGSVERMAKTNDTPTFFEIMTAMAFMHFVDKETDIAVIETGLGGRLDSTNVIEPKVVGITSLSLDHMQQLGKTIESDRTGKSGHFQKRCAHRYRSAGPRRDEGPKTPCVGTKVTDKRNRPRYRLFVSF